MLVTDEEIVEEQSVHKEEQAMRKENQELKVPLERDGWESSMQTRKSKKEERGSWGGNKMGAIVLDLKGLFFKNVSLWANGC